MRRLAGNLSLFTMATLSRQGCIHAHKHIHKAAFTFSVKLIITLFLPNLEKEREKAGVDLFNLFLLLLLLLPEALEILCSQPLSSAFHSNHNTASTWYGLLTTAEQRFQVFQKCHSRKQ